MAKIQLFIRGNLQGQYPLNEHCEIKVGRSIHCDIVIQNIDISRHHCTFKYSGGQWLVMDAGSANGTFVNGEGIKRHILHHSDRVSVGQHTLLFDQYGILSAKAQVDLFEKSEAVGQPAMVMLYRDELLALMAGNPKSQSMALVLATGDRLVVPLVKAKTTIGSHSDCDLRISGLFVKPIQAWIVSGEQDHTIINLGGLRDLYVNGQKITLQEAPLKAGDVIEIAGNLIFYGGI